MTAGDEAHSGDDGLWLFSLAFYARGNVSEALIKLQDRAGCDVNLMLFTLWLGVSGRNRLTSAQLRAADRIIAPIRRDLIQPLRRLRRKLRSYPEADVQRLREEIKRIELAAERIAQNRLMEVAGVEERGHHRDARLAAAIANLTLYLGPELAGGEEVRVISDALQAFVQH